tara:strand:- start:580 stop:774 length:195 start_codon:yes stop_codon:yes gene_type:complete
MNKNNINSRNTVNEDRVILVKKSKEILIFSDSTTPTFLSPSEDIRNKMITNALIKLNSPNTFTS